MERVKPIVTGAFMQLGKIWKVLLLLYGSLLLFFVILDLISRSSDQITLSYFTRDISAIGNLPFFAGLVSQLGGLLWSAALTICIFVYFVLRAQEQDTRLPRRFLLQAALLTGVLLLDDFFLFHEDIGPDYLHISERLIVLSYGLIAAVFLFSNLREILASEYLILGLALILFGLSIFVDAVDLEKLNGLESIFNEQFSIFLEDGFKFVGVATWLVYFARYGLQRITALMPGYSASS
jgi:hypothetical protein